MKSESQLAAIIRAEMWALRDRLRADPTADPLVWVSAGHLACSQRPLRDHPLFHDKKPLPPEAGPHVVNWVERIAKEGICSIVCLMHPSELRYYNGLIGMEDGLLALYRHAGLQVCSLPWPDPAHGKDPEERKALRARVEVIKIKALDAFRRLPKPVLIHCSAAIDRSTPVAAYVAANCD